MPLRILKTSAAYSAFAHYITTIIAGAILFIWRIGKKIAQGVLFRIWITRLLLGDYRLLRKYDGELIGTFARATKWGANVLGLYCDNQARKWYIQEHVIPYLGREDIDSKRYNWSSKKPVKCNWKEAKSFKLFDCLDFKKADFLITGNDLIVRFTPSRFLKVELKQPTLYLTIRNFKEISALQVLYDICGYDSNKRLISNAPLGINFDDGILTIWHELGLKLGYTKGEKIIW